MEKKKKSVMFFHYLVITLLHILYPPKECLLSNKWGRIYAGFVKKLSPLI